MFGDKKIKSFESKFYEFINTLENNNILYEVKDNRNMELGDIIIYCNNNLEYSHIGLVYNDNFEIISKFGTSFVYLTPFNNHYFKGQIKVYKINDQKYYENFKNKFIPLIERIKMNKSEIMAMIDNLGDNA